MRQRMGWGIGIAVLSATGLVIVLMYVAAVLSTGHARPWGDQSPAVQWGEVAKIAGPGAALVAGVIAAVIAGYGHQARIDEVALAKDSDLTDRYTQAVAQLGNTEQLATRLGGIFALERIHADSERDRPTIELLLAAFIGTNTRHAPFVPRDDVPGAGSHSIATDAEAALQALIRIRTESRWV